MATVIQINSLEALERLIGGDTNTEINIRNSVVQEFSKKHLKHVIDLNMQHTIGNAIQQELLEEFFTPASIRHRSFILEDHAKAKIKAQLTPMVHSIVQQIILEMLEEKTIKEIITTRLNAAVDTLEKSLLPEEIEKRFKLLVDKKVRETFGV